jgi:hypothetical protein
MQDAISLWAKDSTEGIFTGKSQTKASDMQSSSVKLLLMGNSINICHLIHLVDGE